MLRLSQFNKSLYQEVWWLKNIEIAVRNQIYKSVPFVLLSKKSYSSCEALGRQVESGLPTNLLVSKNGTI